LEREIPFLKGYTVFNVEQIDGLPAVYSAKAAPQLDPVARIERAERFFAHHLLQTSATVGIVRSIAPLAKSSTNRALIGLVIAVLRDDSAWEENWMGTQTAARIRRPSHFVANNRAGEIVLVFPPPFGQRSLPYRPGSGSALSGADLFVSLSTCKSI
jgi:antirestriction protein ArdC